MAVFESKPSRQGDKPEVKPGQVLDGPAPQGDNPDNQHTAKGVIPPGLESVPQAPVPAAGLDPDSALRAAKHALAAADPSGDEHAKSQVEKVGKARALIAERNRSADPARVEAIDAELKALGFAAPVATTEVQRRGDDSPVGRRAPGTATA